MLGLSGTSVSYGGPSGDPASRSEMKQTTLEELCRTNEDHSPVRTMTGGNANALPDYALDWEEALPQPQIGLYLSLIQILHLYFSHCILCQLGGFSPVVVPYLCPLCVLWGGVCGVYSESP